MHNPKTQPTFSHWSCVSVWIRLDFQPRNMNVDIGHDVVRNVAVKNLLFSSYNCRSCIKVSTFVEGAMLVGRT